MDIVIAGGGTAGWISAYIIEEAQPRKHNITVIESSSIGIIGAGEGSTGVLYDLVSGYFFGRPDEQAVSDFLQETDSTPKFGIYHKNWSQKADKGYFAPLDDSATQNKPNDVIFNHVLANYGPEKAHLASYMGQSYESDKFPNASGGFHFNAHKVGQYFKKRLEYKKNITVIDSVIKHVELSDTNEISSLHLENSQVIEGDLFFDCTGFSRVLMSKLDNPWVPYSDNLIADRAMPFTLDYDNESKKSTKPYTTAHSLSSGWMWDIPLQNRRGCGYVYSSAFISESKAQEEIESYLGRPIEPIKHLRFTAGRSNKVWVKNCIASGLSAVFMEPLEATSIHTTIIQMLDFAMDYLSVDKEKTVNEANSKLFNNKYETFNDLIRDFLVLHYQGGKTTSEFWKYLSTGVTKTPFVEEILERSKYKPISYLQFEHKRGASVSLWNWVAAGLGFLSPEVSKQELKDYLKKEYASTEYQQFSSYAKDLNRTSVSFNLENFIKL